MRLLKRNHFVQGGTTFFYIKYDARPEGDPDRGMPAYGTVFSNVVDVWTLRKSRDQKDSSI